MNFNLALCVRSWACGRLVELEKWSSCESWLRWTAIIMLCSDATDKMARWCSWVVQNWSAEFKQAFAKGGVSLVGLVRVMSWLWIQSTWTGCPPHFQKQVGRGNRLQSTSLQQLKHWCSLWRTGTSCNAQVDQVEQLEQGKVLQAVQQGTGSAAVETVRQSAQLLEKCF